MNNSAANRQISGGLWNHIDALLVGEGIRDQKQRLAEREQARKARYDAYMRGESVDHGESKPPACDGREVS